MANFVPVSLYLQYGAASQYLAATDIANQGALKGGAINGNLSRDIRSVRKPILWAFGLNPNDPSLNATALYLYQLCGIYIQKAQNIINGLGAGLATITGPSNQSGNVGFNAVFSVTVVSATAYSLQWFRNGILIPGQTGLSYTLSNAQLSDSSSVFFAQVTNGAGVQVSATATLTVTASLVASYYFGGTDYSTLLNAGTDSVAYVGTFPITTGNPLSFIWPSGAANNQFIVVRYPVAESTKTAYANGSLNVGTIPSIAFASIVTIGSFKYIFSRTGNAFSQDTTKPLIFS